jgi:hypothetical protein
MPVLRFASLATAIHLVVRPADASSRLTRNPRDIQEAQQDLAAWISK